MKVTGTLSTITFDLENGYKAKANGEMLVGGSFVVYMSSFSFWEPPYNEEKVTAEDILMLKQLCEEERTEDSVELIWE